MESGIFLKAKRKASSPVKKAKKSKKVSDGIKKPTSAYIYFVSDYRLVLKKKGKATNKVNEVAKMCGTAWNAMKENEKAPYYEKYNIDKARYLKEKEALDKKMGKDPNKPKRCQTAYFFFLHDFREQMKGKALLEGEKIPALAGEKWRSMTDDEKKVYNDMVQKDKQRYEKAMEEWKSKNPDQPKKSVPKKKIVAEPEEESSDDVDESEDDSEEESEEEDSE
ncbi:uncharacterized protein LOC100208772 isoform X1 [Hydra vulgaris]|uniref:Uncharacterized protein LOC100208772 isoform X1 n=1 Tax=Hydra vulgaris TaxID=6087 RepID=A0ABM4D2I2_HYDVU